MPRFGTYPLVTAPSPTDLLLVKQGAATKRVALSQVRNTAWFNVKDFGAVGNGVADDTAAIQAAVNAASLVGPGPGSPVYAPAGTYKLTSAIVWPDPSGAGYHGSVPIIGDGRSNTIFSYAGPTSDAGDPFNRAFAFKMMGQVGFSSRDFSLVNAGAVGTTVGIYMDSDTPTPGTVGGQCSFYDIGLQGFFEGMTCGSGVGRDVSEVLIVHPHLVGNTTGILFVGQNSITLKIDMIEAVNNGVAVKMVGSQSCHIHGGSTALNGCDFAWDTAGAYSIIGVRGEQTYMLSAKAGYTTIIGCQYTQNEPANAGYMIDVWGGAALKVIGCHLGGAIVPEGSLVDISLDSSLFNVATEIPITPTPQTWTHGAYPTVWGDGIGFGTLNGVRALIQGCSSSPDFGATLNRLTDAHGIYNSSNVLVALNSL